MYSQLTRASYMIIYNYEIVDKSMNDINISIETKLIYLYKTNIIHSEKRLWWKGIEGFMNCV